jgi:hypothetical protein
MQELTLIQATSAVLASSRDPQRAVERIADLLTEIPGIAGVEFPAIGGHAKTAASGSIAVAVAPIRAGRRTWGLAHRITVNQLTEAAA